MYIYIDSIQSYPVYNSQLQMYSTRQKSWITPVFPQGYVLNLENDKHYLGQFFTELSHSGANASS